MGMKRVKGLSIDMPKNMKSCKETAVVFILLLLGFLAEFDINGRNFIMF